MAEEKDEQPAATQTDKESARAMKSILMIGVPAFLVQLVLVYFLTAKFLVPISLKNTAVATPAQSHSEVNQTDSSGDEKEVPEEYLFVIKDLIINPAGTNGQRYLLITIGFNVSSETARREMEKKELAVRDVLNSILTSKTMEDLIDVSKRELLRHEVFTRCKELIKSGKLQSVYFSKYIIQ